MTDDGIKTLDRDAALKFIRNVKVRSIYVRGASDLPTTDGKAFCDITAYIPVSKRIAGKYVTDLLSDSFHNRGAKIRINTIHLPSTLFIG